MTLRHTAAITSSVNETCNCLMSPSLLTKLTQPSVINAEIKVQVMIPALTYGM